MSEFVQFEAREPIVVPASEEVVYDKYWMSGMNVMARNPNGKVRLGVTFVPCRDVVITPEIKDDQGNVTQEAVLGKNIQPNAQEKRLVVEDVFALAARDAEVATVMNSLFTVLKRIATERGVL